MHRSKGPLRRCLSHASTHGLRPGNSPTNPEVDVKTPAVFSAAAVLAVSAELLTAEPSLAATGLPAGCTADAFAAPGRGHVHVVSHTE